MTVQGPNVPLAVATLVKTIGTALARIERLELKIREDRRVINRLSRIVLTTGGQLPLPPAGIMTIQAIVSHMCDLRGQKESDVLGKCKTKPIAHLRQEIMSLAAEAGYSTPEIGRALNRDHSTVVHGIKAHRKRVSA